MVNHAQDFVAVKKYEILQYSLIPTAYSPPSCVLACYWSMAVFYCTGGHEGAIGDLSCMSIFSACFGLLTTVQLPATTWSGQIWISR